MKSCNRIIATYITVRFKFDVTFWFIKYLADELGGNLVRSV